jgi:hypothetical protein
MPILLMVHSILRWIIVIVAVIAGLKFLIGWLASREYTRIDRILLAAYSGLIDLQVLIGLIFFVWTGVTGAGFSDLFRWEHAFVMVLAAVAAHAPMRWAGAPDRPRYRNNLLAIVASLILIYIGVSVLPGGWAR